MYKDLINYTLAENVTKEHLLKIAGQIINSWMKNQPGFIDWQIHEDDEGNYVDIVTWRTKEDAKNAEKDMVNIPNANDWYSCYKEGSINSKNVNLIASF